MSGVYGRTWSRLSPKAATNAFARIAKKAGVRTTSLHSTRHTAATTAIRSGADIVTVSRMLNHSNPSVTLNIYGHLVPGAEDSTNDMLSDWLDGALSAEIVNVFEAISVKNLV
jgi:integrase